MNPMAAYVPRRGPRFAQTFSENDWLRLLLELGVRATTASRWAEPFADAVQPSRFSAGMRDLTAWLPQILHESAMLERTQENLSYSAERIVQVWPLRFPSEAYARPFARNPEALANKVYGHRMGNTMPGDGWRYRGRGPIMLTGRAGYRHVGDLMGQDLENMPDLIEHARYGLDAAVAWWEGVVPDEMLGDQVRLRRRVNGGEIGLSHCRELAELTCKVLA